MQPAPSFFNRRQIGQDWNIAQSAERNSNVTELAVPSDKAIVRLRSSIALRPFLFALAGSSWEVGGDRSEKHRVFLLGALGIFSQEQAVISGGALSRSSKYNDFSV